MMHGTTNIKEEEESTTETVHFNYVSYGYRVQNVRQRT